MRSEHKVPKLPVYVHEEDCSMSPFYWNALAAGVDSGQYRDRNVILDQQHFSHTSFGSISLQFSG
jgi:hypothetical protein